MLTLSKISTNAIGQELILELIMEFQSNNTNMLENLNPKECF